MTRTREENAADMAHENEKQTVYLLAITHKHGTDTWVYSDQERALTRLAEWVREWWSDEGLESEPPDDDETAIATYFSDEGNPGEYYDLTSTIVDQD